MYKSDIERLITSLNTVLELSMLAARSLDVRNACRAVRSRP
jgi:hypothetical protein